MEVLGLDSSTYTHMKISGSSEHSELRVRLVGNPDRSVVPREFNTRWANGYTKKQAGLMMSSKYIMRNEISIHACPFYPRNPVGFPIHRGPKDARV